MHELTFQWRSAMFDDLDRVVAFCAVCDGAVARKRLSAGDRLRELWTMPGFHLSHSTRLVVGTSGQILGYVAVYDTMDPPVSIGMQLYVHPQMAGTGIGELLLAWAELRAREALPRVGANARVLLWTNPLYVDMTQIALLRRCGYTRGRTHVKMQIDLHDAPPRPMWPEALTTSSFASKEALFAELPALMEAVDDAFQDTAAYVRRPLSERVVHWRHRIDSNPDFDPRVWYVVRDGPQIAAFCLCVPTYDGDPHKAHVNLLGVRRPWRRQGLGLALLYRAFGEFYRRGKRAVDLGVDTHNPTGAARLYERAGMRVMRRHDDYEKEIQGGRRSA